MLGRLWQSFRAATQGAAHRWWVLAAVECGNFVVYMDGFIVTLALPAMAREFGVGLPVLKWVLIVYLFTVTVTLLPAGRLADIWGRKHVTLAGLVVLAVGAALCAVAPTVEVLIACRVLQGIGGGLVLANVMAEITSSFPKHERRKAMSVNAAIMASAQVTGLVLGGLLIDQVGWRSLFVIVLAGSLLGLLLCAVALLPRPATAARVPFDWFGAVLAVGTVGAPFLLVERFSGDLLTPNNLLLLTGSVALLALFVIVERRSRRPLLDLSLFRSRPFTCGSVAASFYFIAAVSCYFLLPLYAQVVLGLSPVRAGLLLVPLSAVLATASLLVGRLSGQLPTRLLTPAGMLCVSGGLFGLSLLGRHATNLEIIWPLVLLGIGGGLFNAPNNTATLGTIPPEHLGVANGFLSTARNFGQAIGTSIAAMLLVQGLGPAGAENVLAGTRGPHLDDYVEAQQFAFRLAAAFALVGAIISVLRGTENPVPPPASQHPVQPTNG